MPQSPVKSQALRNVLHIAGAVVVLAVLVIGGWYGYSKIRMHKYPPGLVASWSGEGNGSDSVGKDNATVPSGVTYAPAQVGLGFKLNGQNQQGDTPRIIVPDAPDLNFGVNQDFSITAWIHLAQSW